MPHSSGGTEERLLRLLQEARQKLEGERQRRSEPVAIVGMACRLPGGASSPDQLWSSLVNRVDATGGVPLDRWDAEALYSPDRGAPGKACTRRGAFLDRVDGFDPGVFGLSPREVVSIDPQQRLLLEVTWEALENASIPADGLKGTATGVWIGLSGDDYARLCLSASNWDAIDPYVALGSARSAAAGRIAYAFGLQGPVIQLDTACSSSLVALHLAVRSLRAGECNAALVGGVNLLLSPETTIALSKLDALAKDGRCKAFDADADGFGRGEGCGVVVLKRLSDARAAGDRIVAVIRGTAVNHDGRGDALTAPNVAAEESVIRAALKDADIEPEQVGYVEAHGAGTPLGDPIEALALARVYGAAGSRSGPLLLGSIKTNLGHLEGAAGIAGVIKAALCLSHGRIPPQLHLRRPNPRISWQELKLKIVTDELEWVPSRGARLAGVSAFGMTGTNAHAVLEQAPTAESPVPAPERSAELFVLSAKTPAALQVKRVQLADHLERHPEYRLSDLAYSLLSSRPMLEHRWAFATDSLGTLIGALRRPAEGSSTPADEHRVPRVKVAFVFPERGPRWVDMGRHLLAEEDSFRDALRTADAAIRAEAGWSVLEELARPEESSNLSRIEVWQPTLFALQVALASLWKAWGVQPDAVVGHGLGEVAAGCASGALSLRAAAAIICRTSTWLGKIRGEHGLALVEPSLRGARLALAGAAGSLEPVYAELIRALEDVAPQRAEVPLYSTVTGNLLSGLELVAQYWADNLRQPMLFEQSIRSLIEKGVTHFVEVSPHPLLLGSIGDILRQLEAPGVTSGSLQRERPERLALLDSLGVLHTHGHPLDAGLLFTGGARRLSLPNYPWQRERYWLEPRGAGPSAPAAPPPAPRASAGVSQVVDPPELPSASHVSAPTQPSSTAPNQVATVERLNPLAAPRVRLFGFHDAGGSASSFELFRRSIGDDVEIHTVSSVREHLAGDALAESVGKRYLEQVVGYIRNHSDVPYVLFGHSLGAHFAWHVTKALQRERVRMPRLLVLSAAATPPALQLARTPEGLAEIFERLVGDRWRGVKNLRAGFYADFALWCALPDVDSEPIDVEIVAFAGRDDVIAGEQAMREWQPATTVGFSLSEFPGGHFYIYGESARAAMLEVLREKLRRV